MAACSSIAGLRLLPLALADDRDVAATLDLTIASRGDLKDGATVPQATLRIEQPGRDVLILPLGGLIGCKA